MTNEKAVNFDLREALEFSYAELSALEKAFEGRVDYPAQIPPTGALFLTLFQMTGHMGEIAKHCGLAIFSHADYALHLLHIKRILFVLADIEQRRNYPNIILHRPHQNLAAELEALRRAIYSAKDAMAELILGRQLAEPDIEIVSSTQFAAPSRQVIVPPVRIIVRPARLSVRLAAWSVRLMPVRHRAEYRELFLADLYDLAQDDASQWAQFRHCLNVLVRMPTLCMAVRSSGSSQRERSW